MSLEKHGRRTLGARFMAWLLLANMVVGQWQMAIAGAPGPVATMATGTSKPEAPTAPRGKVERIRPAALLSLDPGVDSEQLATLFDDKAGVGLITSVPAKFKLKFAGATAVQTVGVYGDAEGALAILSPDGKGEEKILDLRRNGRQWNRFSIGHRNPSDSLVLEWRPARSGEMLREIELWGQGAEATPTSTRLARLPEDLFRGLPVGAEEFGATGNSLPISVATVFGGGEGGLFKVKMEVDPRHFERTFLAYELSGISHFISAPRKINDGAALGRIGQPLGAPGGLQIEEISPRWLRRGINTLQFLPADESDPVGYRVENLRIVGVPAERAPVANADEWRALLDDRDDSEWRAVRGKKVELREWAFASPSQPEAVEFRLSAPGTGALKIATGSKKQSGNASIDLTGFSPGWHRVELANLPPTERVFLSLTSGDEHGVSISELAVSASPLPVDSAPRMRITYPLSGECTNHRVYVRGFLEPAGPADLFVKGVRKEGAVSKDGSLAFEALDRDVGARGNKAFDLTVEARYAGGARVRRVVPIAGCVEQPALVRGDDGRTRQPVEDTGAPYSGVVRAKSASTLSFAGATLDAPAGAVERDMRVSIRPLDGSQLPPLDPGMTNVTPGQQAFRFGPHGMVFKKPVKLALPYDKKLIPQGYTQWDVRTFYFDETLKKWQQVGLLTQGDGALLAMSEHFTDFINATISTPESPGVQSMNPTAMKDIKVAHPGAGIGLIEPPEANNRGTANLRFPIEVPPGRRGMQPSLAITYDSDGGNGWLGLGWSLNIPSIEIDTRFGTPEYDGTETYLLDGVALTPTGTLAPGGGDQFRRRVEGTFDWIARHTVGGIHTWQVTDKNGVVYTYGGSPGARLASPSDPTHVFRWFLETVQDPYGNTVQYFYRLASGTTPGLSGSGSNPTGLPWVQVYPDKIEYTRNSTLAPTYSVVFHSSQADHQGYQQRLDSISNARAGFDVRTNELLDEVEVRHIQGEGTPITIRRYHLFYKAGYFGKTLLDSIGQYASAPVGSDPTVGRIAEHKMAYTTASATGGPTNAFASPAVFGTLYDSLGNTRTGGAMCDASNNMWGGQLSVGASYLGLITGMVGGGATDGEEKSSYSVQDMNSDAVPDGLSSTGMYNLGAPMSAGQNYKPTQLGVVGNLRHTKRGAAILSGSISGLGGSASAAVSHTWSDVGDDRMLIDLDGDGFTDLAYVDSGDIWMKKGTWNGDLGADMRYARVDMSELVLESDRYQSSRTQDMSIVAPLVRWIAPYAGNAVLTGPIIKKAAGGDGVVVQIYRPGTGGSSGSGQIWSRVFAGDDLTPCTPSTTQGCGSGLTLPNLVAGEAIYLLIDGRENTKKDDILWDPTFTYSVPSESQNLVEPTGAPMFTFSQSGDFRLAGRPGGVWKADSQGSVQISWTLLKLTTSDNVRLRVWKIRPGPGGATGEEVWHGDYGANQVVNFESNTIPALAVLAGDELAFEVLSDTAIDPARVDWRPEVRYTDFYRSDPDSGSTYHGAPVCGPNPADPCTLQGDPDPTFLVPGQVIRQRAQVGFPPHNQLPLTPTMTVKVTQTGSYSLGGFVHQNGLFSGILYIQGVNRLYKKAELQQWTGYVVEPDVQLQANDQIFFTILNCRDSSGTHCTSTNVNWDVAVGSTPYGSGVVNLRWDDPYYNPPTPLPPGSGPVNFMSGGYRQWSYGDWAMPTAFDPNLIGPPPEQSYGPPPFMFVVPNAQGTEVHPGSIWMGRAGGFYIGAGAFRPGRTSTNPLLQDDGLMRVLTAGEGAHWDVSAGAAGFNAALNFGETESSMDLIDLNGDRRPDLVARNGVRFGLKGDGFGPVVEPALGTLRHTDSQAIRLTGGIGLEPRPIGIIAEKKDRLVPFVQSGSETSAYYASNFGANADFGTSVGNVDLMDINGDGLVDQVKTASGSLGVRLNLGGRWSDWISWALPNSQASYEFPVPHPGLSDPNLNALRVEEVGAIGVSASGGGGGGSGNYGYGFSMGGGWVYNVTRTLSLMADVNGDGLPDQLIKRPEDNNAVRVKLNQGTSFAPEETWNLPSWPNLNFGREHFLPVDKALAYTRSKGWNGSFGGSFCYLWVCISGSVFYVTGSSYSHGQMVDIDGDGLADQVLKVDGDPNVYFKRNQLGGVNLLSTVTRPLGGSIELSYRRYGNRVDAPDAANHPTIDMPHSQWALSKVRVTDGNGSAYSNFVDYSAGARNTTDKLELLGSGFYERDERENYGYSHVVTRRGFLSVETGNVWEEGDGSFVEQFYHNQDYYRKGLLKAQYEIAPDDRVMRGTRFEYVDPSALPTGTKWFFPAETERKTIFFEGKTTDVTAPAASFKYRAESRSYDAQGNLVDLWDDGDEQGDELTTPPSHRGPDNVHYHMTYTEESSTHITRASSIVATDNTGGPVNILRSRSATYISGKGTVESLTNFVYGGRDPATLYAYSGTPSTHTYTYDSYGNVKTHTDPRGYQVTYTYDSTAQTYRTAVEDVPFGYKSYATPNYLFGTNASTTDINGQVESYVYDDFGRLTEVRGPNDQPTGPSAPLPQATIAMVYSPGSTPPYAVTKHKDWNDANDPNDTIDTVTFIDGLGRVIQTKKDLEKDVTDPNTSGAPQTTVGMSVSGVVKFDKRGRVASQGQPTFSTAAATTFVAPDPGEPKGKNPTEYLYDSLGRTTTVTGPDGAITTTEYLVSSDDESLPAGLAVSGTWLVTRTTDPLGNSIPGNMYVGRKVVYDDVNGRRVAVKEYNQVGQSPSPAQLITQYQYTPMGEVAKVIDAKLKETTATYDSLGQMVTLTSPDAGRTEFLFDLNGNLGAKQTAVLAPQNKLIRYTYELSSNRLKTIDYPYMTRVTYEYGAKGEAGNPNGNIAGRIKKVTMEGGSEERRYDRMGNVSQTVTSLKHMQQPSLPNMVFTTKYEYDSFGRMKRMFFPNWVRNDYTIMTGDGEEVTYRYDHGGNLDSISGYMTTKNPEHPDQARNFAYLNHIGYDEFEQRRVLISGNGIANWYGYDPLTRRLKTVNAASLGQQERQLRKPPTPFHAMTYYYDLVGNILKIENATNVYTWQNASVRTGPMRMDYSYDNMYQLKSATGKYRPDRAYGYDYSSTFLYDETGNLVKKSQLERRLVWDNQNPPLGLAALEGSRPDHTVTNFSYTLDYTYGGTRPHAASRIRETSSTGSANDHVYTYDGNGNNTGNAYMGSTRTQTWDEENRLKEVKDATVSRGKFLYSPNGERTQKQTAAGDSKYVNQYYVYQPNKLTTKHIFAGETRIVTKTENISYQEPVITHYHPDHLGSTSYTSAKDQTLLQHERYFPFGERDIGDQEECDLGRPDNMRREWLFNSKERDWDTGLYYFGARYFDPKTNVWQSPDPILSSYMRGQVNAGVFAPRNLGLYTYTWNNPIVLRDPDGRFPSSTIWTAALLVKPPTMNPGAKHRLNIVDVSKGGDTALFRYGMALTTGRALDQVAKGKMEIRSSTEMEKSPSGLTVYLVEGTSPKLKEIAKTHGLAKETMTSISRDLSAGNVGDAVKEKGVAFIPADFVKEEAKQGTDFSAIADAIGNLTKHEAGHLLSGKSGAWDHSTGQVMSPQTPNDPAGYSPTFRKELEKRVR